MSSQRPRGPVTVTVWAPSPGSHTAQVTGLEIARGQADEARTWELLRALDDPEHLEFPAGYDHRQVRERFNRLAERLNAAFDGQCIVDRAVQDASVHGRVDVPTRAAVSGRQLAVLVSNFGNLAVVAVDNPGVWDDDETAQFLNPSDAAHIYDALNRLGYVLIREDPLWEPYDGTVRHLREQAHAWWNRYFDYL